MVEEQAPPQSFRLTRSEADALAEMSRRMGIPKSAVIRAGIRALWQHPELFLDAPPPAVGTDPPPKAPPPPPRKRRGRRR